MASWNRDVPFAVLVDMFEAISKSTKPSMKRKHLQTFLDYVYKDHECFSVLRLILPELDRKRSTYGLKETFLAKILIEAMGLSKDSSDAQKLLEWRKGGKKIGKGVGSFPLVASEVLQLRQRQQSAGVTIRELNDLLDSLAEGENKDHKVAVMRSLLDTTNIKEMKWILAIILKEMKLGFSERTVLAVFHPDSNDLFNVTCDLELVCQKLVDRKQRYKRQDIEPGHAVRPQLASRVASAQIVWKQLKGKSLVVETKFDGDRIQVHKDGDQLHFFSRSFIDHQEYREAMAAILLENILPDRCILDGEMTVWDTSSRRFVDFGSNQTFARAGRDGTNSNAQLCYIAFDILYVDDHSVIHQPLRERQEILLRSLHPVKGRLELLSPKDGLNSTRDAGEPLWSKYVESEEDIQHFFLETVESREEGVIIKDLDSKWDPGDRSKNWLKLKPDYVNAESDLDVLIIGGYYGSGRNGGEIAQYLLGIAQKGADRGIPTRFISFCRVGTGLSNDENQYLLSRLQPYFRVNERNSCPPSCYKLTGHNKERPDVWIEHPSRSVVVQVKSDIRTIQSEVFASPYSLRFPRIEKVRYDKPWYDCLDEESLVKMVMELGGSTQGRAAYKSKQADAPGDKTKGPVLRPQPAVLSHLSMSDTVQRHSGIFSGLLFYFVNGSTDMSREEFHEKVAANGGRLSMNLIPAVTHSVAADKKGFRFTTAAAKGDVVHYHWFLDCLKKQKLLPINSKYFLNMSEATRLRRQQEVDPFGDSYFDEVEADDLKLMFDDMDVSTTSISEVDMANAIKHSADRHRLELSGISIFAFVPSNISQEQREVAIRTMSRMGQEAEFRGGRFTTHSPPTDMTHVVAYAEDSWQSISATGQAWDFPMGGNHCLVSHKWLEEFFQSSMKPLESHYSLTLLSLGNNPEPCSQLTAMDELQDFAPSAVEKQQIEERETSRSSRVLVSKKGRPLKSSAEPTLRRCRVSGDRMAVVAPEPSARKESRRLRKKEAPSVDPNDGAGGKLEDAMEVEGNVLPVDSIRDGGSSVALPSEESRLSLLLDEFFPSVKKREREDDQKREEDMDGGTTSSPVIGAEGFGGVVPKKKKKKMSYKNIVNEFLK